MRVASEGLPSALPNFARQSAIRADQRAYFQISAPRLRTRAKAAKALDAPRERAEMSPLTTLFILAGAALIAEFLRCELGFCRL